MFATTGTAPGVTKVCHRGQRNRPRGFVRRSSALIPAAPRGGVRSAPDSRILLSYCGAAFWERVNRALRRFAVLGYNGVLGGPARRVYVSRQTFHSHIPGASEVSVSTTRDLRRTSSMRNALFLPLALATAALRVPRAQSGRGRTGGETRARVGWSLAERRSGCWCRRCGDETRARVGWPLAERRSGC